MSFKDFVLDFFFPPRCVFCGAILEKSGDGVCETCRKALPRTADTERKCDFVRAYTAPFYYEPPVRQGVLAYKFRNAPSRGKVFGRILGEDLLRRGADDFDLISWVPLSAKRCHRRSFSRKRRRRSLERRLCRCCAKHATFHRSPGCVLRRNAGRTSPAAMLSEVRTRCAVRGSCLSTTSSPPAPRFPNVRACC